jgi:hypothetical protein
MKALFLLSIVAPVGLLVLFRLTGVLEEPPTPESITIETVTWNMSRPSQIITIDKWINNYFNDGSISISAHVHIAGYRENWLIWPSDGDDDIVDMSVDVDANVSEGYIYSVTVRISKTDVYAFVEMMDDPDWMKLENLTKKQIEDGNYLNEALFTATSVNKPNWCSLEKGFFWVLLDKNSANHLVTITLEATYFDGTAFRKINVPIRLGVLVP